MELISREEAIKTARLMIGLTADERENEIRAIPTAEERKEGKWIRTGRTNIYGGEELMCPFCGDRVMVQNIEYELYCRQCGALLGDRMEGE